MFFERYDLVAAPVVDAADRLVGVITVDNVVDVIEEEAKKDRKRWAASVARGIVGLECGPLPRADLLAPDQSRHRVSGFLVLGLFEGQLQQNVALAVLAPIVASQGGNATTQIVRARSRDAT